MQRPPKSQRDQVQVLNCRHCEIVYKFLRLSSLLQNLWLNLPVQLMHSKKTSILYQFLDTGMFADLAHHAG